VPIRTRMMDLAFLSQALHHAAHPERAIAEAWRILKPGGRIAILDLGRHHFEKARETRSLCPASRTHPSKTVSSIDEF